MHQIGSITQLITGRGEVYLETDTHRDRVPLVGYAAVITSNDPGELAEVQAVAIVSGVAMTEHDVRATYSVVKFEVFPG